jgi:hypothetical protein
MGVGTIGLYYHLLLIYSILISTIAVKILEALTG